MDLANRRFRFVNKRNRRKKMKKTLTAVAALALVAGSASASLTTQYGNMSNLSGTSLTSTTNMTVSAGDVIVMATVSNKKTSLGDHLYTSTGGTFTEISAGAFLGVDANPETSMAYLTVGTSGTYDFTVGSANGPTANIAIYTLSASSGNIAYLDGTAEYYTKLAASGSTTLTTSLSWGAGFGDISVIGASSHVKGNASTVDLALDVAPNAKRMIGTADATGSTSYSIDWDIVNPDAVNKTHGSAVAAGFGEVIPEPATMGMIGFFGAAILFIRRRFAV
jgi:hypothetical protein